MYRDEDMIPLSITYVEGNCRYNEQHTSKRGNSKKSTKEWPKQVKGSAA